MKTNNIIAVILAGGKGTRMGGKTPKPLLKLVNKPILEWTLDNLCQIGVEDIRIVVLHKRELFEEFVSSKQIGKIYIQGELKGTAKAVEDGISDIDSGTVLVLFGDDSGLYLPDTLKEFIDFHHSNQSKITVMTANRNEISTIGGLDINNEGFIVGVLTQEELNLKGIKENTIACGAFCFDFEWLSENLKKIKPSTVSGEYPLPGLINIATSEKVKVLNFKLLDENQWNSVNTPEEYKKAQLKKKIFTQKYA